MSGDTAPRVVDDYRGVIQLLSDGTVIRSDPAVLRPPGRFPDVLPGVQWEDTVYDAAHGLKLRMYRAAAGDDAAASRCSTARVLPQRRLLPRDVRAASQTSTPAASASRRSCPPSSSPPTTASNPSAAIDGYIYWQPFSSRDSSSSTTTRKTARFYRRAMWMR
ncbi:hypothetical protein HU200_053043 [Digitaria exilis]|uniref:Uncharacterized protein n=1 Tax=Digitaria exilis TaxID=1010633 RepID=A0A835AL22_9POAL|nr:hypothetical protein HU200_053043 [Digitaria exilis]